MAALPAKVDPTVERKNQIAGLEKEGGLRSAKWKKRLLISAGCLIPILVALILLMLRKEVPDVPLRFWSASLSPDGKLLATGGGQTNPDELPRLGELIFWDVASGKKKEIVKQESTIRSVALASNRKV